MTKIRFRPKILMVLLISILFHTLPSIVGAGDNKWTKVGQIRLKSLKGKLTTAAISPANPKTVYVVVDDSLVKKSTCIGEDWYWDWHQHWILINKGLQCKKINKLVFNPYKPSLLYACTNNGLYVLNEKAKQWAPIGLRGYDIYAIAFEDQEPNDIKYVASAHHIIKSSNYYKEELIPFVNSIDTIHALCISSDGTRKFLYISTNKGISKISENDTTTRLTSERKGIGKRKVFELLIDKISQFIFAITDSGGVYWAHNSEWEWRNLNEGLKYPFRSMLSIASNHKKIRILYIITVGGEIFEYKLISPRIALLEFNSSSITPWERIRISSYFNAKLPNVFFISSTEKKEKSPLKIESIATENLQSFGKAYGFDIIIMGDIYTQKDKIYARPRILYTNSGRDTTLDELASLKDTYYPALLDDVIHHINCEINSRNSYLFRKYFMVLCPKWIYRGFLAGIIYYSIKSFIIKSQKCKDISSKSLVDPIP